RPLEAHSRQGVSAPERALAAFHFAPPASPSSGLPEGFVSTPRRDPRASSGYAPARPSRHAVFASQFSSVLLAADGDLLTPSLPTIVKLVNPVMTCCSPKFTSDLLLLY